MKKYEYLVVDTNDEKYLTLYALQLKLEQLGRSGWLLVSVNDSLMYFIRET